MKTKLITILFAIMILCVGGVYALSSSPVSAAENNEIVFDTSSVQSRAAVGDFFGVVQDNYVHCTPNFNCPPLINIYVYSGVQFGNNFIPTHCNYVVVDYSSCVPQGYYLSDSYAMFNGSRYSISDLIVSVENVRNNDAHFYFVYSKLSYTVTFDLNGGTRTGGGALTQSVEYGSSAVAPVCERVGYDFAGWDKSFSNVTSDLTVRALWGVLPSFTVTFDLGAYGQRTGGGALVQTIVQGGSAVAPTVSSTNGFLTFAGWDKSLTNIQSNTTIKAVYNSQVEFTVRFSDEVEFDVPNPVYTINTFLYNRGFFTYLNGSLTPFTYSFSSSLNIPILGFDVDLYAFGSGERVSFYISSADLYNYSSWQDNLIPHYLGGELSFTPVYDKFQVSFKYITGVNFNPSDGSVSSYDYTTKVYEVEGGQLLNYDSYLSDIVLNDYTGAYFAYWTLNDNKPVLLDDIFNNPVLSNLNYIGFYVARLFNVTFWNQFEKLGSAAYRGGIGAIKPPSFTFSFGTRLVGWSLELNGAPVDLTRYPLTGDIDLYALTNFTSSPGDVSFDIAYNECQWYDIGCHLGNFFFWFLNECPLVSDIVKLVVPFGQLFNIFVDNIILFDSLGWIFGVSIGLLFLFFIFKVFN